LDIGAREYEKLAAAEQVKAQALQDTLGEMPVGQVPDLAALKEKTMEAVLSYRFLLGQQRAAEEAAQRAQAARERLEDIPEIDLDKLLALNDEIEAQLTDKEEQISLLEQRLAESRQELSLLRIQKEHGKQTINQAQQHLELRAALERVISESARPGPSPADLEAAELALQAAQHAETETVRRVRNLELQEQATYAAAEAARLGKEATHLRRKSKQTDEVLSEIVGSIQDCPLRVENGRLVLNTSRGPTLFSDLSIGEKYRVVLPIALRSIGKHGLIVLSQEAFEGLDPINRQAIATMARELGILIITAECSDDPLLTTEVI
jgi:hypothetical protein